MENTMKEIRTLNGIVLTNAKAFIAYLNTIAETYIITDYELYGYAPCIVWFDEGWHIEPYNLYRAQVLADLDIDYDVEMNVFDAYKRITDRMIVHPFEFNGEAIRITKPIPKHEQRYRKARLAELKDLMDKTNILSNEGGKWHVVYSF